MKREKDNRIEKKSFASALRVVNLLLLLSLYGCYKVDSGHQGEELRVEIELSGAISTLTRASIDPPSGNMDPYHFPPRQLSIGVVLVNYNSLDPTISTGQPDANDWNGALWRRAYFGGSNIDGGLKTGLDLETFVPTNGEIKFTNSEGTAVNKVFYDENGLYSFLKAVHPYEGASVHQAVTGGSILFQGIDGSQDIMCSNLGWGRAEPAPDREIHTLTFRHLLTKLNILMYAEETDAIAQYGKILEVGVAYQPEEIIMDIESEELLPASSLERYDIYHAVGFDPLDNRMLPPPLDVITPDPAVEGPQSFGYVMAIPAEQYTIVVQTEERLYFYPVVTLSNISPFPPFQAGKVYNVTLKFLAADEITIDVEEVTEWWMDSTFN